jgi:hypothetical protein
MVRIPRTEQSIAADPPAMPNLVGEGWGAPGRAMQKLGQGIEQLGAGFAAFGQKDDEEAKFGAQLDLVNMRNEQDLDDLQRAGSYDGDGTGYQVERTSTYDGRAQALRDKYANASPRVRQMVELQIANGRGAVAERAQRFETERRTGAMYSAAETTITSEFTKLGAVAKDLEPEQFDEALIQSVQGLNALTDKNPFNEGARRQLRGAVAQQFEAAYTAYYGKGRGASEPGASERIIKLNERLQQMLVPEPMPAQVGPQSSVDPTEFEQRVSPEQFFGANVDVSKLPLGMRLSNNPTNIKFTGSSWQRQNFVGVVGPSEAKDQGDPQVLFANPAAGYASAARLALLKQEQGMGTVRQLIAGKQGWTPGFDAAADNVSRLMGIKPDDAVNLRDPPTMQKFLRALTEQEHGPAGKLYGDDLIQKGVSYALGGGAAPRVRPGQLAGPSQPLPVTPDLIGKDAATISQAVAGRTPGVVHAVTNETARNFDPRGYGGKLTGAITVNGRTYQFVTGGTGRGSLPLGEYAITRFTSGSQRATEGRSFRRDAFELSDARDDAPGTKGQANRQGLLIHDGNNGVTAGCVGIIGNFEQFKRDLQAEQQKNGGRLALNLAPTPTKADGVAAPGPAQGTRVASRTDVATDAGPATTPGQDGGGMKIPSDADGAAAAAGRDTRGLLEPGNIDLTKRKVLKNADGSISTISSMSVNFDGKEVLIPTVVDGKRLSEDEAIEHYKKTGEHLGMFDTPENAEAFAKSISEQQGQRYTQAGGAQPQVRYRPSAFSEIIERNNKALPAWAERDRAIMDGKVRSIEERATLGQMPPEDEIQKTQDQLRRYGTDEQRQRFASALIGADVTQKFQKASPEEIGQVLSAYRERARTEGASPALSAHISALEKIQNQTVEGLNKDQLAFANKVGTVKVPGIAPERATPGATTPSRGIEPGDPESGAAAPDNGLEALRDRAAQARAVAQYYGRAPVYFTDEEKKKLSAQFEAGGPQLQRTLQAITQAFGRDATAAMDELAKEIPAAREMRDELGKQLKSIEDRAKDGQLPPEMEIAATIDGLRTFGTAEQKEKFIAAINAGVLYDRDKKLPPQRLNEIISALRDDATSQGTSAERSAQIAALEKLHQRTVTALNEDQMSHADKVGIAKITPIDPEALNEMEPFEQRDALRLRAAQANAVAQHYGRAPVYFTKNEKDRYGEVFKKGGPEMVATLNMIVDSMGPDAERAIGEFAKDDAPEASQLGWLVANGANTKAIKDIAEGIALRNDPKYKSITPSASDARVALLSSSGIGRGLMLHSGVQDTVIRTANILYDVRAHRAGLDGKVFDPDLYGKVVQEVLGQTTRTDADGSEVTYGGATRFSGYTVILPPNVKTNSLQQVLNTIQPQDFLNAQAVEVQRGVQAGDPESGMPAPVEPQGEAVGKPKPNMLVDGVIAEAPAPSQAKPAVARPGTPVDERGRPLPMSVIRQATPVYWRNGQYLLATSDPTSDEPRFVGDPNGPNGLFVLDLKKLEPILKRRRPDLYRPG